MNAKTFTSPRILLQNTNTTKRDIFYFYMKSINRVLYHTFNAKVDIYFKLSKFF